MSEWTYFNSQLTLRANWSGELRRLGRRFIFACIRLFCFICFFFTPFPTVWVPGTGWECMDDRFWWSTQRSSRLRMSSVTTISLFNTHCRPISWHKECCRLTGEVTCSSESLQLVLQPLLLESQDLWFPLHHSFHLSHHPFLSILQSFQNARKALLNLRLGYFRSSLQTACHFLHIFGGLRDHRDLPLEFVCQLRDGLCLFVDCICQLGVLVTLCWMWRHCALSAYGLLAAFTVIPNK